LNIRKLVIDTLHYFTATVLTSKAHVREEKLRTEKGDLGGRINAYLNTIGAAWGCIVTLAASWLLPRFPGCFTMLNTLALHPRAASRLMFNQEG